MTGIDRQSDRPAYKQLADILRQQILQGDLEPGAELASKKDMADTYDVSVNTVEGALRELKTAGLIVMERGRNTRVRPVLLHTSRRYEAGKENYNPDQESRFAREHGVAWSDFELDRVYETIPAPKLVAAALRLEPATPVVRRRWIHAIDGVVTRVSWSYLEQARFGNTILCDMDEPPWPGGTIAQLTALGFDVRSVPTDVGAREGTEEELELLGLEPHAHVIEEWRVQVDATRGPLEVAHRVYPEASARLRFVVPVNSRGNAADFWHGISYD